MEIIEFLDKYGIAHHNDDLFKLAITHPSCKSSRNAKKDDYQRLEFLGDSLIGFVVSYLCYKFHPEMDEGEMTLIKSSIVSGQSEARYCKKLGLDECIEYDEGISSTIDKNKVAEDVFEAYIGALLLDNGRDYAIGYLEAMFLEDIKMAKPEDSLSPKSRLQEALQSEYKRACSYKTVDKSSDPQNPYFFSSVSFDGQEIGKGYGSSKAKAETNAASDALSKMALPDKGK